MSISLSIIFARYTTPEVFGQYNFIISIMVMIALISIPGLNISVLRSVSRGYDGVYKKAIHLSFLWSLVGIPLFLLIGSYYYINGTEIVGICLFLIALFFPFYYAPNIWVSFLQGKKKYVTFAKYSSIQTIVSSLAIIAAIVGGGGNLFVIFIIYLITNTSFTLLYYYKTKKLIENNNEDDSWKKSGYKLTLSTVIATIYDNFDKIIIGILLGPTSLAIYVVASSIIMPVRALLKESLKIIYPYIFETKKKNLIKNMKQFILFLMPIYIFFVIIMFFLLPYIIDIIYTTKYSTAIVYAQLYLITIPLFLIMSIGNSFLIATHSENKIIKFNLIGIIFLLICYLILIPKFGIFGAILASIIYLVLLNILQFKNLYSENKKYSKE